MRGWVDFNGVKEDLGNFGPGSKRRKKAAGSSEQFYLALLWLVGGHSGCVRTVCGEDSI